jgi:hypothetical protein
MNFHDFGVFNRAGKTVSKIGIYSKPPPKTSFYSIFNKFATQFRPVTIFSKILYYADGFYEFTTPAFGIVGSSFFGIQSTLLL